MGEPLKMSKLELPILFNLRAPKLTLDENIYRYRHGRFECLFFIPTNQSDSLDVYFKIGDIFYKISNNKDFYDSVSVFHVGQNSVKGYINILICIKIGNSIFSPPDISENKYFYTQLDLQ